MQKKNINIEAKIVGQELKLLYYNDCLLEYGIISKREHRAMNLAIINESGRQMKNCKSKVI